jgi:predicted phosphodiesterase
MKYGILGDIHSNLEALDVVLDYLRKEVDRYISVGDLVGYAASPNECIDRVRGIGSVIVAGNHDCAVTGKADIARFNPYAREAVIWTKETLTKDNFSFLSSLDLIIHADNCTVVHASLDMPDEWTYIMSIDEADLSFRFQETAICFIGHTHYPGIFRSDGKYVPFDDGEYPLKGNYKFLVNVGSIGQPRDGSPDACAVIFDSDKSVVKIKRIAYNVKKAQDKIIKAGLPKILASRLTFGR